MRQPLLTSMLLLPLDANASQRELDASGSFLVQRDRYAPSTSFKPAGRSAGPLRRMALGAVLLLKASAPAQAAVPSHFCLQPMPAMERSLRERIAPEALCGRAPDATTIALPVRVAPQDVPTTLGRVTTEYVERPAANAWLIYADHGTAAGARSTP